MCCRYFVDSASILEEYGIADPKRQTLYRTGEIAPSDIAPVIANNRNGSVSLFPMKWGYSLGKGHPVINARSETAADKPVFADSMKNRRCLIPALHYYEWENHNGKKIKYAIQAFETNRSYLAGIYRIENGVPVFTVLTREPAENIRFIHDRMPVLLPEDMKADWLNPVFTSGDLLKQALTHVIYHPTEPVQQSFLT